MAYRPIEDYGLIGDMQTVALVSKEGSIDWFCFPYFDSPSVFGAILDDKKGGRFKIAPVVSDGLLSKQFYWPDTNVLATRFFSSDGVGELLDFMPVDRAGKAPKNRLLVRRVSALRGELTFSMECSPAFNYAREKHEVSISENSAIFNSESLGLQLSATCPLRRHDKSVISEFTLDEGETIYVVLSEILPSPEEGGGITEERMQAYFDETVRYWHDWLSKCKYTGRWREIVYRSALVLKLLTFEPTGAIVASPTCSLPEIIGGERNWDYRYTWIRDAAFTLYALLRIGFTEEAENFMHWLEKRCHEVSFDGSLQIMYTISGSHDIMEETLDHLEGYMGSRPVRVGNAAHKQLQLDIYGELMDSVYLYNKYGAQISYNLWTKLRKIVDWVCENAGKKDHGIWEIRGEPQHFVYSKLMCWVALDRGLRLADKRSFPADRDRWIKCRDKLYEDIMTKGWSEEKKTFVQHYDGDSLDAANLIMPLVFFVAPNDPRMLMTLEAISRSPSKGGLLSSGLVYRYDTEKSHDGIHGPEGTFNICTFWLVEALTRAGKSDPRHLESARVLFERMLGYASHLGLYAEETAQNGVAAGNFPQAFTHLALISAAFNLDRALGGGP
jgi:GH15 family glucan-1,4-alpha-glucosidase